MSSIAVFPEAVSAAAADVANIGRALSAANAAATVPTTNLLAAGTDEISTAVASLFSGHGQAYQRLANQLMAFHDQFAQALTAGASAYTGAEATNASPLQTVEQNALGLINAPTQTLLGRPLIGDGAAGTATNPNGGAGGLLYGNGGQGASGGRGGLLSGAQGVTGTAGDGGTGGDGGLHGAFGAGGDPGTGGGQGSDGNRGADGLGGPAFDGARGADGNPG